MKKLFLGFIVLSLGMLNVPIAQAGVNEFKITDYQMDMYLSKDAEGRSTLRTVEKISAQFPDFDQNHGIERAIPDTYDGHPVSLKIDKVTDGQGGKLDYSTYDSSGNSVLRIGDAERYVHGSQIYVIEYSQRDVTRYFEDTKSDEFYWDTNGVDWRVPIENLKVTVHVDESLSSSLDGNTACYLGASGEQGDCELSQEGSTFTTSAQNLKPGENLTVSIGSRPGTFAAYQQSLWEKLVGYWLTSLVVTGILSVIIGIWLAVRFLRVRNRTKEVGTIVPEYIPPKDTSVTAAAEVIDLPHATMTAQILDLAVRHYLKIYETKPKSTFKQAEYDLEIVKAIDDLKWEEQELARDLFSGNVDVGSRMSMKSLQKGTGFYNRIQDNDSGLKKRVRGEYELRVRPDEPRAWFKRAGWVLLAISLLLLSPFIFASAIVSFALSATLWQLTDKGLELRRYMIGLKDYISVAEEERIKMLQSPEGAAKVGEPVDGNDQSQLVKLYERVLPYAVLFGQEKEWNKQLGAYYESLGKQPSWYAGNSGVFNAAAFTSGMNSFAASVSYANPTSSSSGGSGGGGFSGGGGGGGGGGGW